MKEKIKKLAPVSIYDMKGMENWLQEYAAKGYRIEKIANLFVHFIYIEPTSAPIQYRLMPNTTSYWRPRKPDFIIPDSWQEIPNSRAMGAQIYVCYDENGEDLYTTQSIKSDLLLKICKALSRSACWTFIGFIAISLFFAYIDDFTKSPIMALIDSNIVMVILFLLIFLRLFIQMMSAKKTIKQQNAGLQNSKIINHPKIWIAINIIAFFCLPMIPIAGMVSNDLINWYVWLETMQPSVPTIDLKTIESNYDPNKYSIFVRYTYSPFAPVRYEIDQGGYMYSPISPYNEPYFGTVYYRLINPYLAEKLMDDLSKDLISTAENYTELSNTGFDRAVLINKFDDTQYLIALQNNEVISLSYNGNSDLSLVTDELKEKMEIAYSYKPKDIKNTYK